jgi:hypothetical protein
MSKAEKINLYIVNVIKHAADGTLLMFHLEANLVACNVTLSEYVYFNKI